MELIPAIDIRDGRCVRLLRGEFDRVTRYDVDAAELAARYRDMGARWLHVVDLDGAEQGRPVNLPTIERIRAIGGLRVQLGGGIRGERELEQALELADRAVIGSLAVTAPEQTEAWLRTLGPERLTLALDVRLDADGTPRLTTHGWTRATALALDEAIERYSAAGLRHVLCTDVARDGALEGPNVELYRRCAERFPAVAFQASGGVRDARDLEALAAAGAAAAISGKALLEGRITTEELEPFLPGA